MSNTAETITLRRGIDRETLDGLSSSASTPHISIAIPTHTNGPEVRGDAIRLKNAIASVRKDLETHDVTGDTANSLLESVEARVNDELFWRDQGHGLLVLIDGSDTHYFALDHSPREFAHVGSEFFTAPLVRDLNNTERRMVLAVSKQRSLLLEVVGSEVQQVDTPNFPAKYDDLITPRDPETQLQYHTQGGQSQSSVGGNAPIFHGQGEGEHKVEADEENYYARILQLLSDTTRVDSTMVVMATEEVAGHLLAKADFQPSQVIGGSIDGMTDAQIAEHINHHIEPAYCPDEDYERLGTAIGQQQGSMDLDEIETAAREGRIDTLFVRFEAMDEDDDADSAFVPFSSDLLPRVSKVIDAARQTGAGIVDLKGDQSVVGNGNLGAIYRF